jgi:hypothetical protein
MFFYDDATQGEIKMSNSNGNGNGNLIEALLAFASKELTSDQAAKLNNLIENNSDPRATYAKDKVAPENAERAIDLLRQKGVSESDIDKSAKSAALISLRWLRTLRGVMRSACEIKIVMRGIFQTPLKLPRAHTKRETKHVCYFKISTTPPHGSSRATCRGNKSACYGRAHACREQDCAGSDQEDAVASAGYCREGTCADRGSPS